MPLFVEATLLYKAGKYEAAVSPYEQAIEAARTLPLPDLHYYYADTLTRLDRYADAEAQLREEMRLFPRRIQPRTSLAMLYRAQHRNDDAQRVVEQLTVAVPTPEGYAAAARLWAILGDKDRAATLRADAKERFGAAAMKAREPIIAR